MEKASNINFALINFNKLAPAMTGIARKKLNSDETARVHPKSNPPKIVAPLLDVPGINASIWKHPIRKAVLNDN